jgi:hypothetical protein
MAKIRARYMVKPLGLTKRLVTKATIDKETKSMDTKVVEVEEPMFMVLFPQGHSVRMNLKELKAQGLDKRPRMVDMDTGDVIDTGGDPFDFENMPNEPDVIAEDDDFLVERTTRPSRSKTAEVN